MEILLIMRILEQKIISKDFYYVENHNGSKLRGFIKLENGRIYLNDKFEYKDLNNNKLGYLAKYSKPFLKVKRLIGIFTKNYRKNRNLDGFLQRNIMQVMFRMKQRI